MNLISIWTDPDEQVRLGDVVDSIEAFIFDIELLRGAVAGEMKEPCVSCPYKKKANTLTKFPWLINLIRIKLGLAQNCHFFPGNYVCKGAIDCIAGGNDEIRSVEEFACIIPCKTIEESKRNWALLEGKYEIAEETTSPITGSEI